MEILNELKEFFKSKNSVINIEETENSYKIIMINNINNTEIIEDLEIAKYVGFGENKREFITEETKDSIMNQLLYLYHNSLDRYIRGDNNVSNTI